MCYNCYFIVYLTGLQPVYLVRLWLCRPLFSKLVSYFLLSFLKKRGFYDMASRRQQYPQCTWRVSYGIHQRKGNLTGCAMRRRWVRLQGVWECCHVTGGPEAQKWGACWICTCRSVRGESQDIMVAIRDRTKTKDISCMVSRWCRENYSFFVVV